MKLVPIDRSSRSSLCLTLKSDHDVLASLVGLEDWIVEFVLVEDQDMRDLNNRFRQKDSVTDVLSFPELMESGDGPPDLAEGTGGAFCDLWRDPTDQEQSVVGVIAMAPGFIEDRCLARGWDPEAEFLLLMAHGLLHLLGWDHQDQTSRRAMVARETELLAQCGRSHPMRDEEGE